MTPAEHYAEAERLIAVGESVAFEIREARTEGRRDALGKQAMGIWAQAQVHATLAAQWSGRIIREPGPIVHGSGCAWEVGPTCSCGADPQRCS